MVALAYKSSIHTCQSFIKGTQAYNSISLEFDSKPVLIPYNLFTKEKTRDLKQTRITRRDLEPISKNHIDNLAHITYITSCKT